MEYKENINETLQKSYNKMSSAQKYHKPPQVYSIEMSKNRSFDVPIKELTCDHAQVEIKHLFTSSYKVCKKCKEEL